MLALGGVDPATARACVDAGAAGVAVMGGIMRAADPAAAVRALVRAVAGATAVEELDHMTATPRVALTIAGSDSGGGAGIQADLVTFAALGVHGASVVTALTAQNTVGVAAVHVPPLEFLQAQLDAVLDDLPVAAVKTGMLATEAVVRSVGERAAAGRLPNLVVDPVLVSSTGARLLDPGAESAYLEVLLPHALVATPNTREASALLSTPVETVADAGRRLRAGAPGPGGWWSRAGTSTNPGEGPAPRRSTWCTRPPPAR